MENNIVLQREDSAKIFISSNNSVKNWLRHLITIIYCSMTLMALFSIDKFAQAYKYEWIFKVVGVLIVLYVIRKLMIINLKALYYSFSGYIFSIIFYLLSIGYGFFISLYIPSIKIDNAEDLYKILIYFAPVFIFIGFWKIFISTHERKTNYQLCNKLLLLGFNQIIMGIIFILASLYYEGIMIDFKNHGLAGIINNELNRNIFYTVITLGIISFGLYITSMIGPTEKSFGNWILNNIAFSKTVFIFVPVAIWFIYRYLIWIENYMSWILVSVAIFTILTQLYLLIFAKDEIRSTKIFMNYSTLSICLLWIVWYIYGHVSTDPHSFTFSTSITLFANAFLVIVIYFKSPDVKKIILSIYISVIQFIVYIIIALWIGFYVSWDLMEILTKKIDLLNITILIAAIIPASTTLLFL